jgi:ankyrin repeat protein
VAEGQPAAALDHDSDDDEDEANAIPQEVLDADLLNAARENNTEAVILALEKGGNALYEKDGWNPLLWAACNGNEAVVRLLIKRNACDPYIKDNDVKEGNEEEVDPFRKPEDAKKIGKYTPLHWASYKGYHKVVWILLKQGMSPLKID